jgi:hypothetical protein
VRCFTRHHHIHLVGRDLNAQVFNARCASGAYGIARTDLGPVLISCKGVTPYLDGYKVQLAVTVLAPVKVVGMKLTVSWLESDEKLQEKGKGPLREKEIDSLATFIPGQYTFVEVPLSPASASGIKDLGIKVATNQVNVVMPREASH